MPRIPVHKTWQMNILQQMEPPTPHLHESRVDALNTSTPNLAVKPTLNDGPLTGNFTLLLTSSGHKWQFHIATDI